MLNRSGHYIKADLASVNAAAASAANKMPDDFRVSITDAPGEAAYPISSFTWILVPSVAPDAVKSAGLIKFLQWGLGSGQEYLEPLAYARLPGELVVRERNALARLNASNQGDTLQGSAAHMTSLDNASAPFRWPQWQSELMIWTLETCSSVNRISRGCITSVLWRTSLGSWTLSAGLSSRKGFRARPPSGSCAYASWTQTHNLPICSDHGRNLKRLCASTSPTS